jgi:hypothetical protein
MTKGMQLGFNMLRRSMGHSQPRTRARGGTRRIPAPWSPVRGRPHRRANAPHAEAGWNARAGTSVGTSPGTMVTQDSEGVVKLAQATPARPAESC